MREIRGDGEVPLEVRFSAHYTATRGDEKNTKGLVVEVG